MKGNIFRPGSWLGRLSITLLFLAVPITPIFSDILDDTEIVPGIRFWGGDLELRYKGLPIASPLVTRWCVLFGCGYEDPGYYRDSSGAKYTPPYDSSASNPALYKRLNLTWAFGIRQGLLFDERKSDNLLEGYLYARGRYDNDIQAESPPGSLIFTTNLPDKNGIFQSSIVTGLFFNTIVVHKQRKRDGISTDLSLELAPGFLGNEIIGEADFGRITFDLRTFFTFLDLTPSAAAGENLFNMYFGNRIIFDALFGRSIPVNARQSIGGRNLAAINALGYSMRGIDARRYDGYMKLIVNTDIRMDFPTLPFEITPGAVLYLDVGLHDNLDYKLDPETKYSVGAGVFIYILGFDAILYGNYFLNENRFSVSFDFSLQF